jgi:hypothetical protein
MVDALTKFKSNNREYSNGCSLFYLPNMKELIEQALNECYFDVEKQIPKTKKKTKSISVLEVPPIELLEFMKENNIPDTAWFNGKGNGYDGYDDFILEWDIEVPMTEEDKLSFRKNRFNSWCYGRVNKLLSNNGYKRADYDRMALQEFKDTTIFDLYMNKDFDRIVKYYSIWFSKI